MARGKTRTKKRQALRALMRSIPVGQELYDILLGLADSADSERAHDRMAAVMGTAFLEHSLQNAITTHLKVTPDDPEHSYLFTNDDAPLRDFAAKLKLAKAMGIISESEYDDLYIIRNIRNAFAHTMSRIDFSTEIISELCDDLQNIRSLDYFRDQSTTLGHLLGNRRVFVLSVCLYYWKFSVYPGSLLKNVDLGLGVFSHFL